MSKYLIKTTDGLSFDVQSKDLEKLDMVEFKDGSIHLVYKNRSFNIEILESDYLNKRYLLNVNEKEIALSLMDELDMKIERMGFSGKSVNTGGEVLSPMPGLVLRIDRKPGDVVKAGDVLLILEAMKMENVIKSPAEGKVKLIHVAEGDTVAKKQLLIELE